MIRPFKDKLKVKQEAYQAEQEVLAEQAEQVRIQEEWVQFDKDQDLVAEQDNQIIAEEEVRQSHEYLEWKTEFRKKQLHEQEQVKNKPIDTGLGMGHLGTWQLTWKTFSTHPKIIDLPMSEKIRLYKIAERQQIDRLNYYANVFSDNQHGTNRYGSNQDFEDGTLDFNFTFKESLVINHSLDVNSSMVVNAGVELIINGILTVNGTIENYGTLIINGLVVQQNNITTFDEGTLIIN